MVAQTEQHCAYDAWNRMTYSHDNFYYHFYYNQQWQTLEVRKNNPADGDPERQYVWDIRYIDAPVVRFLDGNLDGDYADEDDNVLYYCNDANMNVTALVDASDGSVVERYAHTAYGKALVLNPDTWAERQNGSVFKNWHLFAGYRFDDETGLYLVRNRVYQAELGRWGQRDPRGYVDGPSLLEYCITNPVRHADPLGTGLDTVSNSLVQFVLRGMWSEAWGVVSATGYTWASRIYYSLGVAAQRALSALQPSADKIVKIIGRSGHHHWEKLVCLEQNTLANAAVNWERIRPFIEKAWNNGTIVMHSTQRMWESSKAILVHKEWAIDNMRVWVIGFVEQSGNAIVLLQNAGVHN